MKLKIFIVIFTAMLIVGCREANTASYNISQAADSFEINRQIVFYNGITGDYMYMIEGLCSIYDQGNQLDVTCKVGEGQYKKHFLGLSDNVTYIAEQIDAAEADPFRYRTIYRPESLLPDIDIQTSEQ